jgi:DNA-binding NtrC family response regulator
VPSNASARETPAAGRASLLHARRGQVLIVEPEPLTQWALRTYLSRWFSVDSTKSIASAQQVLEAHPVDVLVVSEEFSPTGLTYLERCARSLDPQVTVVRMVADPSKPRRRGQHAGVLEKPFELVQLARLLGIPECELPREP